MKQNDISPVAAFALLLVVCGALYGLQNHKFIMGNWKAIFYALNLNKTFLMFLGSSLASNILIVFVIFERLFGYKKQGSRLNKITNKPTPKKNIFIKLVVSIVSSITCFKFIYDYGIIKSQFLKQLLSANSYDYLIYTFTISNLIILTIAVYATISILLKILNIFDLDKRLSRMPQKKESLVLGTVGEEKNSVDQETFPRWLSIIKKALNGNILVTGSIGTGKTQGTILNYIDQLFSFFNPNPSALILDPKGSFIKEAAKILKEKGLEDKIIYLGDTHAHI